jgi:hypothetical protein
MALMGGHQHRTATAAAATASISEKARGASSASPSGGSDESGGSGGGGGGGGQFSGVERVYFEIPQEVLDTQGNPAFAESRLAFVHHLAKIPEHSDRMLDLHFRGNLLLLEALYLVKLRVRLPLLHLVAANEMLWMNLTFALAVAINCLDLFSPNDGSIQGTWLNRSVLMVGTAHVFLSLVRVAAYAANRYRRILNERFIEEEEKRRKGQQKQRGLTKRIVDVGDVFHLFQPARGVTLQFGQGGGGGGAGAIEAAGLGGGGGGGVKGRRVPFHKPQEDIRLTSKLRRMARACLYQEFYAMASLVGFALNVAQQVAPVAAQAANFKHGRQAFYSLLLLDVCVRNASLERVLTAVSLNRSQLSQTALLIVVIIYVYASFAYWQLSGDFYYGTTSPDPSAQSDAAHEYDRCKTIWQCLVTAFDEGLRNDVGIAEYMVGLRVYDQHDFDDDRLASSDAKEAKPFKVLLRVIFDVSWWVAITLLLTNVVAGIIIDFFVELRETNPQRDYDPLSDPTEPGKTIDQLSQGTFTKFTRHFPFFFGGLRATVSEQPPLLLLRRVCRNHFWGTSCGYQVGCCYVASDNYQLHRRY